MEKTNIIHVVEDREFVNRAKRRNNEIRENKINIEKVRQMYKEKMIDTGKAQELEEKIEKEAKTTKKVIKVAGTLATVALIFIPADGPFGEIATALATPSLCALVDILAEIKKKALITGKRKIEKHILHVDGENKKISGFDLNNGQEIIKEFKEMKKALDNVEQDINRRSR